MARLKSDFESKNYLGAQNGKAVPYRGGGCERVIAFVVLHYITVQDTCECIDSILKSQKKDTVAIVVVDNGSPNDSFKLLSNIYLENKNVHLIRSEKNLGFAQGNNIGFVYAKKRLKAEFIVLLNNDTIITQEDFCEVLLEKYKRYKFAVLGPDIITLDGVHQNPYYRNGITLKQCKKIRRNQYIHILLTYLNIDERVSKELIKDNHQKETRELKNVALHGAAMIFSPIYINQFDGLEPRTFLYFEEDILKLYADIYGFLMMYTPDLRVLHKEDVSSNAAHKKKKDKMLFQYRERIKSSLVYEAIWNEHYNKH